MDPPPGAAEPAAAAAAAATTAATDAGAQKEVGSVALPSDVVAKRGQLRGLGKELVRIDMKSIRSNTWATIYSCWYNIAPLTRFIQAADADLHGRLTPYRDAVLLEDHGEQVLDVFIRLASQEVWMKWLQASLKMVAFWGREEIFTKLFTVHGDSFEGWSPPDLRWLLRRAVTGGSIEVVSAVLAIDGVVAFFREEDEDFFSDLISAAHRGHRRVVAALAEAGAPLEYKNVLGETALIAAVANGHSGVVLDLLAAGADVNNINDKDIPETLFMSCNYPDYTPLCVATSMDNKEIVDILLAAGAHLGEELAETIPLHLAADFGCLGPLESLLVAGADVNVIDSAGRSALHMSCVNFDPGNIRVPQSHCNYQEKFERNSNKSYSVERLLKAGANIDQVNSTGRSALHIACWFSNDRAVGLLLRHGAQPNLLTDEGDSPADLVGMEILNRRMEFCRETEMSPATLNAEETSVVDHIFAMLKGASAWGRRCWLVLMRARHHSTEQRLPLPALSPETPSIPQQIPEQSMDATQYGTRQEEGGGKADQLLSAVAGMVLTGAPSNCGGLDGKNHDGAEVLGTKGDRDRGASTGWEQAVVWLVQCPDERGVFREVLSFV